MNNQAAQTMPAVEAAVNAGLASYHGVKTFSSEVRLRSALEATARAMLAAAPAASAKYCSDERPCTPCFSNNGPCEDAPAASGVDTSTNEAWAARAQEKIEAMDAASGGEACGCIYYGLGKAAPYLCEMHKARKADPHPPPAASVSERARELLAQQYMGSKFAHLNAIGLCIRDGSIADDTAISFALRAIEQALTQQRGHGEAVDRDAWAEALELPEGYTVEEFLPGGWHYAWTRADGERMVSGTTWNHPALAAIAAWQYAPATTPQPSADAVREYVTELRAQADQKMGVAGACAHDGDRARYKSAAQLLRRVADELESLLSAASGEGVDDTKRLDWIARQGGYEFDFGILNDQPGDGDWFVHGMGGSGQGATFRDAIDAAIKEEAGGQDANTDILDTLAFKTENGDAGRGSVTYIALVASGEADHQQNAAQGGGEV